VLRRAARLAGEVLARRAVTGTVTGALPGSERSESVREPLRAAMRELLEDSADLDREQAQEDLYGAVLRQLTPDEARILAVLAAGPVFPTVDVVTRDRTLLRNASTAGDAAGVTLREEVPSYLTRLAAFGLVEVEGERTELGTQYEVLVTDERVRAAQSCAKRAKLRRRSVRISLFGARFWAACDPARSREL
jgi:hypothetical protein